MLLEVGEDERQITQMLARPTRAKSKRQAADLAMERLRILESLDQELRNFASGGQQPKPAGTRAEARPKPGEPQVCSLRLEASKAPQASRLDWSWREPAICLASGRLRRQIPPYMLNLYRQLLASGANLSETVQMMPYQAHVIRSFRQPPCELGHPQAEQVAAGLAEGAGGPPGGQDDEGELRA